MWEEVTITDNIFNTGLDTYSTTLIPSSQSYKTPLVIPARNLVAKVMLDDQGQGAGGVVAVIRVVQHLHSPALQPQLVQDVSSCLTESSCVLTSRRSCRCWSRRQRSWGRRWSARHGTRSAHASTMPKSGGTYGVHDGVFGRR